MHLIYTTLPQKDAATKLARQLIKNKLAACANIYSEVTSIYKWKGELQESNEITMICKTPDSKVNTAIDFISKHHEYACPCVLAIKIEKGNKDFLKWVETSCKVDY